MLKAWLAPPPTPPGPHLVRQGSNRARGSAAPRHGRLLQGSGPPVHALPDVCARGHGGGGLARQHGLRLRSIGRRCRGACLVPVPTRVPGMPGLRSATNVPGAAAAACSLSHHVRMEAGELHSNGGGGARVPHVLGAEGPARGSHVHVGEGVPVSSNTTATAGSAQGQCARANAQAAGAPLPSCMARGATRAHMVAAWCAPTAAAPPTCAPRTPPRRGRCLA